MSPEKTQKRPRGPSKFTLLRPGRGRDISVLSKG